MDFSAPLLLLLCHGEAKVKSALMVAITYVKIREFLKASTIKATNN